MGHRNSSAQCHDPSCLCLDGGGVGGDAARTAALSATTRDERTLVRTEIRTADSSLHCRPVRESADWEEKVPAVPLGMTTLVPSATGPVISHQTAMLTTKTAEGFFASLRMTTLKAKTTGRFFGRQGGLRMTARLPSAAELLLFGIRFYQAVFAQHMPVGCKFHPSCSRYAAEAIERHGAARGARLALARLWRCRPFTRGGFDPVPDADEIVDGAAEAASHSAHEAEGGARAEAGS